MFLACPDFKGIKTQLLVCFPAPSGFWPALISKGLRRHEAVADRMDVRFWPALISKK